MARKATRKVAVIDFETDPFKYKRPVNPFCVEFYSEDITQVFWGEDCAEQLVGFLKDLPDKYLIYAHNGGKFDFHFLLRYIDNPALIIKTRIVECHLFQHTMRDSFAILPVPLRDYAKMEFDYSKMERAVRSKHKKEILEYLHSDCVNLYNLVSAFNKRFGPRMTIGGTAIREIKKLHPFRNNGSRHDAVFRDYFHGGRVQCFKSGILPGPWKLFDRNSMYPAAMCEALHPINGKFDYLTSLPDNFDMPYFTTIRARNTNALPSVADDGSLVFNKREGIFKVCSHELEVALAHNLVEVLEVIEVLRSTEAITFKEFVDLHYGLKSDAKKIGDKITELFEKLLLNSGYGRTSINPANFSDWLIHRDFGNEERLENQGYSIAADYEDIELWSKPADLKEESFCDVAIGASITSAARANLLLNLQMAIDPIYCDTDSIICKEFRGDTDAYRLGAWDLEKEFPNMAIAGKKMYAGYSDAALELFEFSTRDRTHVDLKCSKCKLRFKSPILQREHELQCDVKLSSKGGSLDLLEIVRICRGETVHYENEAPTFSLRNDPKWVNRNFKITAESLDLD